MAKRAGQAALATLLASAVALQGLPATALAASSPALTLAATAPVAAPTSGSIAIDYSGPFTSATPARLKRAGVGIVLRYVAGSRWKSLTRWEANALRKQGIDIAVVYETSAGWMLGGRAAGVAAAKRARAAVIACGGPRTPFVYFACDVDTSRYSAVNACLRGAASVLGADHVGIYGGHSVCASALNSGYATKAWQTEAWSGGKVLPQGDLFQPAHTIDGKLGLDYDSNFVRADDIGQWGYAGPGSVTWSGQSKPASETLSSVAFADDNQGWAVGAGGAVRHTGDGGTTWESQSASTTAALKCVRFADANNGWAVGESGTILHTDNGGAKWVVQSSPTSETLSSADFADASSGWAVGENGAVLHTDDGGSLWVAQTSPTSANLTSVRFADSKNGWAVGESGTIIHTVNGGSTWDRSTQGTAALSSVDAWDSRTAWAVGSGGTVLRTANGGATWAPQSSATTTALTAVRFTDYRNGWAVGGSGLVLRTTNGGTTWAAQLSQTTSALTSVDFVDPSTGWAVGESGALIRSRGIGLSPFGTVVGSVTDAVTGAAIGGVSITIGPRRAAPSSTDGSFIAARVKPATYTVSFSNSRYVTRYVTGVVASAGSRAVVKVRLTPRIVTALTRPSVLPTAPTQSQATTLSVTLTPSSAATAGLSTLTGWRWEQKTVKKIVKGKKTWVRVWYWRQRFALRLNVLAGGQLFTRAVLGKGSWRVQARFAGSGQHLPATSATASFVVK